MSNTLLLLWEWLVELDPTMQLDRRHLSLLRRKRLTATLYDQSKAFARIGSGQIGLFRNMSVPVFEANGGGDLRCTLIEGLRRGFPRSATARIQIGPKRTRRYIKVSELIDLWEEEKSVVSVTDLHFRGTRFEKLINTTPLSSFNILCNDPEYGEEFIEKIEMMTLVISARGNVTDSHTDDCDGTNHCFIGRKLWLAWDRVEGQKYGLQDNTRDDVEDRAGFDMPTFLSLPTARWFVIGTGETLFLPGNLAHKVITLEPYVGVGSFNVTLPGALGTLSRWHLHGTTDVHRKKLFDKITKAIIRRIQELQSASRITREEWGLPYMQRAVARWNRRENDRSKSFLLNNIEFASFIEAALEC